MAIQGPQIFNALMAGRQARQQEDYANSRNALAQQEVQNAPIEADQRRQLNALGIQGQQQSQQMALDQDKAKQGYTVLQYAKRSGDPVAFMLKQPGFAESASKVGVNMSDPQDVQGFIDHMEAQLGSVIGAAPPVQLKTIQGANGAILQQDPTTQALKQVVAPQRQDYGAARLDETTRHNKAMEAKGNAPASAENVEAAANAISNYQQSPLGAYAMRSPYGQAVMARVMEMNPDYQANEFGSRSKAFKDFASGKNGNQVRSFNVAISHLDSLQKVADAMDNGDTPILNKLRNEYARQTGQAAPNTFDGMKKIVTDEIVKSIVGAGGGVADREEASRTIAAANSPAQLAGIMNGYKELMAGQLGGLKLQYEQTTGRKDFKRFLTSEAQGYLDSHMESGTQPHQNGQQQPKQAVQVSSPADALKLAPGTVFVTPDGRRKVR